ncbi:MAG: hypothetical protein DRR06_20880 [Gammaproteobacteria bacterium]|nr:MAG: hypothetical protein DRR06_20880 [Gammaproteobacteria bacterium]
MEGKLVLLDRYRTPADKDMCDYRIAYNEIINGEPEKRYKYLAVRLDTQTSKTYVSFDTRSTNMEVAFMLKILNEQFAGE